MITRTDQIRTLNNKRNMLDPRNLLDGGLPSASDTISEAYNDFRQSQSQDTTRFSLNQILGNGNALDDLAESFADQPTY